MNILAIGAHPDDIEIGCGGTLLKYARAGHNVYLLVLTCGGIGGDPDVRKQEGCCAGEFITAKKIYWGGFNDTELVDNRELIMKIESIIKEVNPDMIFMNDIDDVHQDHRAAAHAGVSASRHIKEVLFYEVPTTQNFAPDIFVDISLVLEEKKKLLEIHVSQTHRTNVVNLTIMETAYACALFRGFQGRVKYAEGFKALRVLRDIR